MPRRRPPRIGAGQRIDEKGRIRNDQVEPLPGPVHLHGLLHEVEARAPRRCRGIFARLPDLLHVDARLRRRSLRALGQHQGDEARTGTDVEHTPVGGLDRGPRSDEHPVGADLHRGAVLPDREPFELKHDFR